MKLKNIIEGINGIEKIQGKASFEIVGIASDSRAIKDGYLFIALKGEKFNGSDFIDEAIDRGAVAVIQDSQKGDFVKPNRGAVFIYVKDARSILANICNIFYGNISNDMNLTGVTGTNGKTTITYLIENIFKTRSLDIGVVGTVNYRFGKRSIPALNTTPGILDLYSLLDKMKKESIKNCVMEASSHSLAQGRLEGLCFNAAIFTNLTREHLDYHRDMEDYFNSKLKLFSKIKKGGFAVVNKDDPYSERIIEKVASEKMANIITYGIDKGNDVYAEDIKSSFSGLDFILCTRGDSLKISSSLIGRYNVYNILAASACGIASGMKLHEIKPGIESLKNLPGRLERVNCGQDFLVFVDYAHTEDGLRNVLKALKELGPNRLFTVFGCGGDRDKQKRPSMGKISSELSDKVYLTSDNPRSEDPNAIIQEIISGISLDKKNYIVEIDRARAILSALEEAGKGDIVLVAGKGHETYQIFKNNTLPFDDREVVRRALCLQ
ncbi:MAG: UDP-N-acetylmuramoyl-L-alanyl-D-glutamate--2,6-diaminopimelate ligase [Candidatus Omnitrophota bacterium]